MYCDFYHLSEKPFNVTPDPKFLYLNARYRETLAALHYGIAERKGFITLIGEAGTGKTTLLNRLLHEVDPKTKTVLIFNTHVTFEEILEYIFSELELPVHSGKKLYMLQRLNAFLLEELRNGGNVALLLDEAQDLDVSVLEDLRLLSNLETAKEKILQIVISGQPELEQKLSSPALRQLRQRVAVNCRLQPLTRDEMGEYIQFRLRAAGCPDPKVFTRDGEDQVWQYSRGIPRLVNVVCDNALVIGYALGKDRIGGEIVTEAAADLLAAQPEPSPSVPGAAEQGAVDESSGGEVDGREEPVARVTPKRRWRDTWAIFGVVAAALLIGLASVGRSVLRHRTVATTAPAAPKSRDVIHPAAERGEPPAVAAGVPRLAPRGGDESPLPPAEVPQERPMPPAEEPAMGGEIALPVDVAGAARGEGAGIAGKMLARQTEPEPQAQGAALSEPVYGVPLRAAVRPETEKRPVEPSGSETRAAEVKAATPGVAANPGASGSPPAAPLPGEHLAAALDARAGERSANGAGSRAEKPSGEASGKRGGAPAEPKPVPVAPRPGGPSRGAQLATHEFDRVTVQDGDSIGRIAARKYGQSSYTILDLMKLANPDLADVDRISVGQVVALPRLGEGFPVIAEGGGEYELLIHSTPVPSRAASLADALRARGFQAGVVSVSIGERKTVYRVVVGTAGSEAEAAALGARVQRVFRDDETLAQLGRYQ